MTFTTPSSLSSLFDLFEIPFIHFLIMFASGKPVWYLPFAFLLLLFLLFSSLAFWFGEQHITSNALYPQGLTAIFSPQTIDALNQDPRLQDALLSLSEAIAQSSTDLGERFRFESLKSFGTNLTDGVSQLRALQQNDMKKRGLLDDLGQAFGNLIGGGAGGLNLTGGLSGIIGGIGGSLVDSLSTPALFLGIGLGYVTTNRTCLTIINSHKDRSIDRTQPNGHARF